MPRPGPARAAPSSVPLPPAPALTLVKDGILDATVVAPADRAGVGDRVANTLTVTNAGNVTLTGVTASDPKLGTLACDVCAPPDVTAGGVRGVGPGEPARLRRVRVDLG